MKKTLIKKLLLFFSLFTFSFFVANCNKQNPISINIYKVDMLPVLTDQNSDTDPNLNALKNIYYYNPPPGFPAEENQFVFYFRIVNTDQTNVKVSLLDLVATDPNNGGNTLYTLKIDRNGDFNKPCGKVADGGLVPNDFCFIQVSGNSFSTTFSNNISFSLTQKRISDDVTLASTNLIFNTISSYYLSATKYDIENPQGSDPYFVGHKYKTTVTLKNLGPDIPEASLLNPYAQTNVTGISFTKNASYQSNTCQGIIATNSTCTVTGDLTFSTANGPYSFLLIDTRDPKLAADSLHGLATVNLNGHYVVDDHMFNFNLFTADTPAIVSIPNDGINYSGGYFNNALEQSGKIFYIELTNNYSQAIKINTLNQGNITDTSSKIPNQIINWNVINSPSSKLDKLCSSSTVQQITLAPKDSCYLKVNLKNIGTVPLSPGNITSFNLLINYYDNSGAKLVFNKQIAFKNVLFAPPIMADIDYVDTTAQGKTRIINTLSGETAPLANIFFDKKTFYIRIKSPNTFNIDNTNIIDRFTGGNAPIFSSDYGFTVQSSKQIIPPADAIPQDTPLCNNGASGLPITTCYFEVTYNKVNRIKLDGRNINMNVDYKSPYIINTEDGGPYSHTPINPSVITISFQDSEEPLYLIPDPNTQLKIFDNNKVNLTLHNRSSVIQITPEIIQIIDSKTNQPLTLTNDNCTNKALAPNDGADSSCTFSFVHFNTDTLDQNYTYTVNISGNGGTKFISHYSLPIPIGSELVNNRFTRQTTSLTIGWNNLNDYLNRSDTNTTPITLPQIDQVFIDFYKNNKANIVVELQGSSNYNLFSCTDDLSTCSLKLNGGDFGEFGIPKPMGDSITFKVSNKRADITNDTFLTIKLNSNIVFDANLAPLCSTANGVNTTVTWNAPTHSLVFNQGLFYNIASLPLGFTDTSLIKIYDTNPYFSKITGFDNTAILYLKMPNDFDPNQYSSNNIFTFYLDLKTTFAMKTTVTLHRWTYIWVNTNICSPFNNLNVPYTFHTGTDDPGFSQNFGSYPYYINGPDPQYPKYPAK